MTARGQFDLVGHSLIRYEEITLPSFTGVDNWIVAPEDPEDEWARSLMLLIGEWRATLRSTYLRWAMAINSVHVASNRYSTSTDEKKFVIYSTRSNREGTPHQEVIAEFTYQEAAVHHLQIQPMLCAHGFIDMYAGLEEMIFALYRAYWKANPDSLIKGAEFKQLRKSKVAAVESDQKRAEWELALESRINEWQRKKIYDGLDKVFLGLCQNAGLTTPVKYTVTTIQTWAESIAGVALIRNLLMHGESTVPAELDHFSKKPWGLGFQFTTGMPLRLGLFEIQVLENFLDQLLTGVNLALVERARPSVRKYAQKIKRDVG